MNNDRKADMINKQGETSVTKINRNLSSYIELGTGTTAKTRKRETNKNGIGFCSQIDSKTKDQMGEQCRKTHLEMCGERTTRLQFPPTVWNMDWLNSVVNRGHELNLIDRLIADQICCKSKERDKTVI